jgi:hypothetical protein
MQCAYCFEYKMCSKKDRTFVIKTLLLILQHFKHCPLQSSLNRAQWYITYVSLDGAMHPRVYRMFKKRPNFSYKEFITHFTAF